EDQRDPASARTALDAVGRDRGRIGASIKRETWWAAPAQGFAALLLVVAPAAGLELAWLFFVASMLVFVGVEILFRKRSGLAVTRPAGPRGVALLIALSLVFVGATVASTTLAIFDLRGWAVVVACATGLATTLGVVVY